MLYFTSALTLIMVILVSIVACKMIWKGEIPGHSYTPFDYIAGQTNEAFHEEKKEYIPEDHQQEGK
ncbi:DUF3951 domain-containing protein [Domibacillus robiginosus]|uniref:DUF3951 domain-containing protein n=1 Tax=Domibacillus robiginosus TaxID=1071054 RepID=UPI00067C48C9|nr:DUF3951 domain-containing protein [Domibacillus robiginosus]